MVDGRDVATTVHLSGHGVPVAVAFLRSRVADEAAKNALGVQFLTQLLCQP